MNNFGGEVIVRALGPRFGPRAGASQLADPRRDPARKRGAHGLGLRARPMSVDYEISVPVWMPVKIEGTYIYIAVEGTQADVSAETVRGDITIKGGATFVTAKSIEGEVILGERARPDQRQLDQSGHHRQRRDRRDRRRDRERPHPLNNVESPSVDALSVNGNIKYDGSAAASGRYRFSTHNGNISVGVPESASATFSVRTYNGSVRTDLQLQGGGETRRGQRAIYTLGSGSAEFELESFGGTIQLRRRGERRAPEAAQGQGRRPEPRPAPPCVGRGTSLFASEHPPGPPQRFSPMQTLNR